VIADGRGNAERIRSALVQSALAAYEDAALQGLCCEGAWEAAVAAMRRLDLSSVAAGEATELKS
jgi:hypothetical protein